MRAWLASMLVVAVWCGPAARAQTPAFPATPAPAGPSADYLSNLARGILLQSIPDPLFEQSFNWGKQRPAVNGLKWHKGKLGVLKPEFQYKNKNDGVWRKVRVEVIDPQKSLVLVLSPPRELDADRTEFDAYLFCNARIRFNQQVWESGARLYSGETRARLRTALHLKCEVTFRLEPGKEWLPDAVFRFRATKAELFYDSLVVEHTAGVGGDMARLLGDAMHDCLTQWKPSLESDLLAKADAAIVKAADTKEIRVSFAKYLQTRAK